MRPGCSAAFSVPVEGQEVLVVVGEVRDDKFKNIKRDAPEVADAVRASLAADHGVAVHAVVLIKHHTVPKTTSGKISRHRAKRAYLDGKLSIVHALNAGLASVNSVKVAEALPESAPQTAAAANAADGAGGLLEKLRNEVARLMECAPSAVDASTSLVVLGMDSMALTQFRGILANDYDFEMEEAELFEETTTLSKIVARISGAAPPAGASACDNSDTPRRISTDLAPPRKKRSGFARFFLCGL